LLIRTFEFRTFWWRCERRGNSYRYKVNKTVSTRARAFLESKGYRMASDEALSQLTSFRNCFGQARPSRRGVITGAAADLQSACVARLPQAYFDAPPFAVGDEVRRRVTN
jgi:hypothetical protein